MYWKPPEAPRSWTDPELFCFTVSNSSFSPSGNEGTDTNTVFKLAPYFHHRQGFSKSWSECSVFVLILWVSFLEVVRVFLPYSPLIMITSSSALHRWKIHFYCLIWNTLVVEHWGGSVTTCPGLKAVFLKRISQHYVKLLGKELTAHWFICACVNCNVAVDAQFK